MVCSLPWAQPDGFCVQHKCMLVLLGLEALDAQVICPANSFWLCLHTFMSLKLLCLAALSFGKSAQACENSQTRHLSTFSVLQAKGAGRVQQNSFIQSQTCLPQHHHILHLPTMAPMHPAQSMLVQHHLQLHLHLHPGRGPHLLLLCLLQIIQGNSLHVYFLQQR